MKQAALSTGASAGLGAEFARQLAAQGKNLVLVARRREPMEALADELRGSHGIEVEILASDMTDPDTPAWLRAETQARGLQVGVLNIADEMDGLAVGVLNWANDGIFAPAIWGGDIGRLPGDRDQRRLGHGGGEPDRRGKGEHPQVIQPLHALRRHGCRTVDEFRCG